MAIIELENYETFFRELKYFNSFALLLLSPPTNDYFFLLLISAACLFQIHLPLSPKLISNWSSLAVNPIQIFPPSTCVIIINNKNEFKNLKRNFARSKKKRKMANIYSMVWETIDTKLDGSLLPLFSSIIHRRWSFCGVSAGSITEGETRSRLKSIGARVYRWSIERKWYWARYKPVAVPTTFHG